MAVRLVGSSASIEHCCIRPTLCKAHSIPIQSLCNFTVPIFQFSVITLWHWKPASILHGSSYSSYYSSYSYCSYSYYCKRPGHWPSPLCFALSLTRVPSPPRQHWQVLLLQFLLWVGDTSDDIVSEFHLFQRWALADWPVTLAVNPFLVNCKGSHTDAFLLRQAFQNFRNRELRQAINLDLDTIL